MIDLIPYRADKNLGKAYNQAFQSLPNESALCLRDYDTLWLTHDYNIHLDEYHKRYPDAVLTCFTNRVGKLSIPQLHRGVVGSNTDIRWHLLQAAAIQVKSGNLLGKYPVTEINQDISGMMLVVPRKVWLDHPFPQNKLCLGVDTYWGREIRAKGVKILRMDGLYIWHSYRLLNGVHDKRHLL